MFGEIIGLDIIGRDVQMIADIRDVVLDNAAPDCSYNGLDTKT
jgi:hypothetical protein